jgi:molybdopterin synthase catalytic subunit
MLHLTNIVAAGKKVTRLVYQAYSKIAIKTLCSIATNVIASATRSEHQPEPTSGKGVPGIIRCAIHHRLGEVPVGEASISKYS